MAQVAAPSNDRKRVKVYELRNNDWFDRGTGFCRGVIVNVRSPLLLPRLRRRPFCMSCGLG
jgi:protein phosphatase-4 regulatory subunit 3